MKVVALDGSDWADPLDFFDALADALGAFDGNGRGFDAFIDTMVYSCELLATQPPYVVTVRTPHESASAYVGDLARYVAEARDWRKANWGDDVDVSILVIASEQ